MIDDWQPGDVARFTKDGKTYVAVRTDYEYGRGGGHWQVAIHGFWRISDAELAVLSPVRMIPDSNQET